MHTNLRLGLLWLFAFLLLGPVAFGKEEPRIVFEKMIYDFGRISSGESVEGSFSFKNDGTAPLRITAIETGCDCTAAVPTEVVKPGESGSLTFRYDSSGRVGQQTLELHVFTNDPQQEPEGIRLQIEGFVKETIRVRPPGAFVQNVFVGEGASTELRVRPLDGKEMALKNWTASLPFVHCEALPLPDGTKSGFRLRVTIHEDTPIGWYDGTIRLETSHPEQKTLQIPVAFEVRSNILCQPDRLVFLEAPGGEPQSAPIRLRRLRGVGPLVRQVEGDEQFFDLKVKRLSPGKAAKIEVTIRADAPSGPFTRLLRLHLEDEKQPVMTVPVVGVVPDKIAFSPSAGVRYSGSGNSGTKLGHVTLFKRSPGPLEIEGMEVNDSRIHAQITKSDTPRVLRIVLTAADSLPSGTVTGELTIRTDVSGHESMAIPLRLTIREPKEETRD